MLIFMVYIFCMLVHANNVLCLHIVTRNSMANKSHNVTHITPYILSNLVCAPHVTLLVANTLTSLSVWEG